MRTTINLDPHTHEFASIYANARGITLSAALNELLRRAEQAHEVPSGQLVMNEFGYYEIAKTGNIVTAEMVKEASEDKIA